MPPRGRNRGRGAGQARDTALGPDGQPADRADQHPGVADTIPGQVGGIEPAVLECSDGSDEETSSANKKPNLVAEGPRYGYKMPNGAFIAKSNFVLKVKSEIESDKYPNLKGNTWTIKLAPSARYPNGSSQEIFIPKSYAKDHRLVEAIIDKQVKGTIDMDFDKHEWKLLGRFQNL